MAEEWLADYKAGDLIKIENGLYIESGIYKVQIVGENCLVVKFDRRINGLFKYGSNNNTGIILQSRHLPLFSKYNEQEE
jgi:hypothetical protein